MSNMSSGGLRPQTGARKIYKKCSWPPIIHFQKLKTKKGRRLLQTSPWPWVAWCMNRAAHLVLRFRLVPFSKIVMFFSRNSSHILRLLYFLRKLVFIGTTPKCVYFSICGFCLVVVVDLRQLSTRIIICDYYGGSSFGLLWIRGPNTDKCLGWLAL